MNKKKAIIIVIIIAAIAIPVGIYTVSPLFINTIVNEPLPTAHSLVKQYWNRIEKMNDPFGLMT
jgi:hypothetical protein